MLFTYVGFNRSTALFVFHRTCELFEIPDWCNVLSTIITHGSSPVRDRHRFVAFVLMKENEIKALFEINLGVFSEIVMH
jgi:hypothetical protein